MSEENTEMENDDAPESNPIREAFDIAVDSGKEEDDIKMDMIGAGAKFKNVTRLFNEFMIEGGYVKSKDERNEILDKVLTGVEISTAEALDEAIAELAEELDVSEQSAATSLRQWAKRNDVECYKKPKGSGAGTSGIIVKIHAWILENYGSSEEEFVEFLKEVGTDNTMRNKNRHIGVLKLAKAVAAKYE